MPVGIRKMNADDRESYFEMSRGFYSSGAAAKEIPEEYRQNFWKEILCGELISAFILEYDGKTAGYALVAYYASQELGGRTAFIDELYVKPEFRGKGIAKVFLAFAENDENVCALRLEAERANGRAINLYSSSGYEFSDYLQMIKIKR